MKNEKLKVFNVLKLLTLTALVLLMSACSYETVPQGTKGKVLDRQGFHPEVYTPSRVEVGWHGKLILVDTTTKTVNEVVTVRMKDNMDLIANVRFRLKMGTNPKSLDAVFNAIRPNGNMITTQQLYLAYGKMIVNKVVREVLSDYKISDVQPNFKRISAKIYTHILEDFKPTPLVISDVALGKLTYPKIIDDAILAAASRTLAIKKAEANVLVKMKEMEGQERVADAQYRIKMKEAKRIRDFNKMIANGVTPSLLKLREIEVQQALVEAISKNDVTTIFIPYGSTNSPGAQMRMFQK